MKMFLRNAWWRKENKPSGTPPAFVIQSDPSVEVMSKSTLMNGPNKDHTQDLNSIGRRGNHGASFNPFHGPPNNSAHAPPNLNLSHTVTPAGKLFTRPPHRPPRPPSLEFQSQPTSSSRPLNRVKFALHRPDTASDESEIDIMFQSLGRKSKRPATSPGGVPMQSYQPARKITGDCASLDFSELPGNHTFHSTSSTPCLRSTLDKGSRMVEQTDCAAACRRPRPLVIPPTPATPLVGRLLPSPFLSSTESTPPVTPTSSTPVTESMVQKPSPKLGWKNHGRLRAIGLPVYSPPDTPLPSPPLPYTVTRQPAHLSTFKPVRKTLRIAHSASDLRQHRQQTLHVPHRPSTTSTSASQRRGRLQSFPTSTPQSYVSSESHAAMPTSSLEKIHYGYAL